MTSRLTDAERWQAVKARDKGAAHVFYYAVKTTGVYCVPGCASRLPRQENVEYFDSNTDAEKAGYRPCKRCRPDDPAHADSIGSRMVAACRIIEQSEEPPSLDTLAAAIGLSPSHFQRQFTEYVGVSPKVYAQALRDAKVRASLEAGVSVTQAIFDAGYGTASRFYERSENVLGMTPTSYKKGGAGEVVRHGTAESFIGLILAGYTDKGVCSIEFGESEAQLLQALADRFPNADIAPGGPYLDAQMEEVVSFIKSPKKGFSLPLDIQGTAFQQRVWRELQRIPAGETRTYTQVAEALGMPDSVRAVASACGRNRLAVAIPCHRVLRKDGDLAGYYWGLERKKALLKNENGE